MSPTYEYLLLLLLAGAILYTLVMTSPIWFPFLEQRGKELQERLKEATKDEENKD